MALTKQHLNMIKMIAANIIAIMLVVLLSAVVLLAMSGMVDLKDSTTSMFVGSLIGNVCGLLQAPLVWYFGHAVINKDQHIVRRSPKGGIPE